MALGEGMFAPSSTQPQTQGNNQEDVYRPTIDLEEGFGDSEEKLLDASSVGVTDELKGVNLRTNTTPSRLSGSTSYGKRKRGGVTDKIKKQKAPSSQKIADAVSMIAITSKDTIKALKEMKDNEVSVREIKNIEISATELTMELLSIKEIASDHNLCVLCCNLLAYKSLREIFIGLRGNREILVNWLRYNAYNPPPFMKGPHQ